ncbi:MAG: FtsX-like permease family protein [Betaproteobacteria bacterium]
MPFEWVVALRFLREGRFQTALIVGGVAAGVAVFIFITALVNGLQANTIRRTLGTQAHIVVRPTEEAAQVQRIAPPGATVLPKIEARAQRLRSIDQWQQLEQDLAHMPGVVDISPMVTGPGFAVRGDASKAIAIIGIDPVRYNRIVAIGDKLVGGEFRVQPGETVLGRELASDLGIGVGDRVRLVTTDNDVITGDTFTVTGIVDLGVRDLNRRTAYVGLRTAQSLLSLPGGVSQLDLTVTDLFDAERIATALAEATGLTVDSWMKTNAQLLAAINAQTITTQMIRLFVVVIVVLGIASVLVVSVVQKRREIGILRAMGASRVRILRVFLLQGAMVALAGSLIGCALSASMIVVFLNLALNADGTPLFELAISPELFVIATVGATVCGVLAAVAPAQRAAALDPAQAIRM